MHREASTQRTKSAARLENLQELVGAPQEYERGGGLSRPLEAFLRAVSLSRTPTRSSTSGTRHADDAARRQGPRVRGGLPARSRGECSLTRARRGGTSRRSGASATSRSPARASTDAAVRQRAHALRRSGHNCRRSLARSPEPRRPRAPRDRHVAPRPVSIRAARPTGGAGLHRAEPAPPPTARRRPVLKVGDNVRHTQLGEGSSLADAGGQVVVRFRADGSERRLLLAYARSTACRIPGPGTRPVGRLRARGAISSARRARARQAGGHWFEPSFAHSGKAW